MKKSFKIGIVVLVCIIILSSVGFIAFKSSAVRYNYALNLIEKGKYYKAYNILYPLGDYKGNIEIMKDFTHIHTLEVITDSDGKKDESTFSYDENGNLIGESYYIGDTKYEYEYAYDEKNQLIKEVRTETDISEGTTTTTNLYEYDENGRLEKEIYISIYDSGDTFDMISVYEYDENGRLIRKIDGKTPWLFWDYIYDENGNFLKETFSGKSDEEYTYDKKNNLIQEKHFADGEFIVQYDYTHDENNNLIKIISKHHDSENAYIKEAEYDSNGNPTKLIFYTDGSDTKNVIETEYDNNGNMVKRTNNIITDESIHKVEQMTYSYMYYNTMQEVTHKKEDTWFSNMYLYILPNTTEEFTYDANENEIKKVTKYSDATESITESTYNENGQIIKSISHKNGEKYLTEEFKYDAYGNLLEKNSYDKDGNIIQAIEYSGFVGKYNK